MESYTCHPTVASAVIKLKTELDELGNLGQDLATAWVSLSALTQQPSYRLI